jgi:hypothetical protein
VVIALVRVTIQTNLENSNEKIDSDLNQGKPSKRGFPLRNRQFETDVVRSKVSTPQRFDPAADEARSAPPIAKPPGPRRG